MSKQQRRKSADRGPVMNDDFREVIAAALLDGVEEDLLAQELASSAGIPLALVESEIARALKSPYLRGAERLRNRLGKWEWVMQNQARLAANDADPLIVPVLDGIDGEDFYRHFYRAHRPVVVRGLFDHWPAREAWNLDHFAERLGDRAVRVQWAREADRDYEGNAAAHGADQPFSKIAERLRSAEPSNDFYITANNSDGNRAAFAPFYREIGDVPGILAPGGAQQGFVWIGPKGTVTPWHHDLTNNLLLQFVGRKRVRMVASHDTPLMRNHRHCFSRWRSADLLPGPAHDEKPAVLECTIGPGEAVFLPIGWWHHVDGLDQTIGMSFTNFAWNNDFHSSYHSDCPL